MAFFGARFPKSPLAFAAIKKEDAFMRCSCQNCGTYMIQSEDLTLGCRCPQCGTRCTACLGTDSVLTPEQIRSLPPELFLSPQEEEEN